MNPITVYARPLLALLASAAFAEQPIKATVQGGVLVNNTSAQVILQGQIAQTLFDFLGTSQVANTASVGCGSANKTAPTQYRKNVNGTLWCRHGGASSAYECRYTHSLITGQLIRPSSRICMFAEPAEIGSLTLGFTNGSFGDPAPASREAAAIHLYLEGQHAEKIFKKIGPDRRPNPIIHPPESLPLNHRIRYRGDDYIYCRAYTDGSYSCNLAFELLTGKAKFAIGG